MNENQKTVELQDVEKQEKELPRIAEMVLEKEEELIFFGTCHCNSKT